MIIKICGITTVSDLDACVEAGADALGFNFWPKSPRFINVDMARQLARRCPPHVLKVGLFVDETADRIEQVMQQAELDVAQLHGLPARVPAVRHWTAFSAATPDLAGILRATSAEAAVIDTPAGPQRGGTGRTFDWSLAAGLPGRIVLAGGLGPDNVAQAIRAVRPWGVDACSRLESAPGRKDHELVRAFIANIRALNL